MESMILLVVFLILTGLGLYAVTDLMWKQR